MCVDVSDDRMSKRARHRVRYREPPRWPEEHVRKGEGPENRQRQLGRRGEIEREWERRVARCEQSEDERECAEPPCALAERWNTNLRRRQAARLEAPEYARLDERDRSAIEPFGIQSARGPADVDAIPAS